MKTNKRRTKKDAYRPVAGSARRVSKLRAATFIATMLNNWMCDGCPTGDEGGEYDFEVLRGEALRFQRIADARVSKLCPPNTAPQGRDGRSGP